MAGFDWNGLGKDIRDLVQDAVNTRDFEKLNNDLNRTIQQAVDGVGNTVRNRMYASSWQGDRYGRATASGTDEQAVEKEKQMPVCRSPLYVSTQGRKAAGYIMAVAGFGIAGILALALLVVVIVALIGLIRGPELIKWLIKVVMPLLVMLVLGTKGSLRIAQVQRFRNYLQTLGGRAYCDLKELAAGSGKSINYVRKDLRRFLEKRWFLQGHLDQRETCLIVTQDMYEQYLETERQREELIKEQQRMLEQEKRDGISSEVRDVLEAGEAYIKRLRKCNEDIPGVEISNKIYGIEQLVQQIFARVKEHPEMVSDIRKMMEYYLPTTIKLLDAYIDLDAQSVQGEHIVNSKREIEEVLDTLNIAFEKLLDSLFRDVAWDVSTDISVLETMLAQEGLTKEDFRREPK